MLGKVLAKLPTEVANDYRVFKQYVWERLALTPEVARQKFRDVKMLPGKSFTEFEVRLAELLQVWLAAEQVQSFKDLQELVLKEHHFSYSRPGILEWVFQLEPATAWEAAHRIDTILAWKNRGKDGKGGISGIKPTTAFSSWKSESSGGGGTQKAWPGEKVSVWAISNRRAQNGNKRRKIKAARLERQLNWSKDMLQESLTTEEWKIGKRKRIRLRIMPYPSIRMLRQAKQR